MDRDAIIRKAKGALGKVQGLILNYRMFLLKPGKETQRFVVVAEVTVPFWSRWSSFREQTVFMWADEAVEWMDRVAQSSHIGYGIPNETAEIEIYSVSPDQRDRVAPNAGSLMWKLYGTRLAKPRFTIPEPEETP
jgi:hypothetical protein